MLAAVLAFSIAPARAQDVDSPPDTGPQGAAVSLRWHEAAQLEESGDFNSAQIQYRRAFDAARHLDKPQLRDCTITGFQARIAAMEAAKAYARENGSSPRAIVQARAAGDRQFEETFDALNRQDPISLTVSPKCDRSFLATCQSRTAFTVVFL